MYAEIRKWIGLVAKKLHKTIEIAHLQVVSIPKGLTFYKLEICLSLKVMIMFDVESGPTAIQLNLADQQLIKKSMTLEAKVIK